MWNPFKRDKEPKSVVTSKCDEHYAMVRRLARIEGENIAIMAMLAIILTIVLTKVI